jgi:hypothetical protein
VVGLSSEAEVMGRGAQTFRQSDLTRALKAAKAAGVEIARIEIARDGTIAMDTGEGSIAIKENATPSAGWDEAVK